MVTLKPPTASDLDQISDPQKLLRIAHPPRIEVSGENTIGSLADQYDHSLDFLRQHLNINSRSRLTRYQDILSRIRHISDSANLAASLQNDACRSSFYEAHQIIEVCSSLKTVIENIDIPTKTLANLKKSDFLSYVEARNNNANDPSRDTFFELFVAAKLIQRSFPVAFTENREDLSTTFEDHKIYIECKRVQSRRQLFRRIHEANGQLKTRYVKGRLKEFGLAFISISNLVNPDFQIFAAPSFETMLTDSHKLIDPYTDGSFTMIKRYGWPHKKTLAFFVHASLLYVTADHFRPVYRSLLRSSSYFHHRDFIPQRGYTPEKRMEYFDEFGRFSQTLEPKTT